jgi:cellulose synthase operon protein C
VPNPMHISFLPTSTPPETAPEQAILEANLRWLREESEGVWSPEQKAAIRHEIGVLEQLAGRDSVAVRDLLASVNSLASFREPLERLIVLIDRHRSFKNLPTLLEHLRRIADNPEEVARAELLQAWHSIVHARDDTRALVHAETALQARPDDAVGLLTLEVLARRSHDGTRLRHALEARRASSADPIWGSLLAIELAASYVDAGNYDAARATLLDASRIDDEVGFAALERLVALGDAARRPEWVIEALGAMAGRAAAVLDSGVSAPQRVPALDRSATRAVARLLRKAELERRLGREADAFGTLEQAALLEADNPFLHRAFLRQAERVGQHATATALALGEVENELTGAEAAALYVRAAQSQVRANELAPALDALRRAASVDSGCWVARALELDLLRGMRDPKGQAEALERVARLVQDSEARGRSWLLAADAWARGARDVARAIEALAQAESTGTPAAAVRRVERALAHAVGEQHWCYESAKRLLVAMAIEPQEKAGLGLELWRAACLSGDFSEAGRFRELVEGVPEGRLTARLARAYDPMLSDEASHVALEQLAELEEDPARSIALRWTGALRLLHAGARARALERLTALHAEHPESAAVAGTLSALLAADGSARAASAQVLRLSAQAMPDDLFAASLYIEAGLGSWQAGQPMLAQSDFEGAERRGGGCAWALSSWTRRANTDPLARMDAQAREPVERLLLALERATSTMTPNSRDVMDLDAALRPLGEDGPQNLVAAGRLLSLVLGRALGMRADGAALDRFAALSSDATRVAEAWRYLECMDQAAPSPRALEESTRKWSETSGGLPAALEWLAATQRLAHRRRECEARKRVGELVSGPLREACMASAMLVAHLTQAEPTTLVAGPTPAARLTNLETSPPGCDPERRLAALQGAAEALDEESGAMVALLAGYNQLALGEVAGAVVSFRRYTEAFPEDPSGWEGLLAAARRGDDAALLAEAASALGSTSRDPTHAARLFEEAADIFLTRLNDDVAGVAALSRAVDLDIRRTSSFEKLFALLRDSASSTDLLELLNRRLRVASLPEEIRTLHWERARALRREGDIGQALSALDEVVASDPRHIGALALAGEIYLTTHRYAEAADKLAELAAREDASPEQRLTSGLAAVDLFENQLGATSRALQVLLVLHRAGLSTLPVRERLARAAAKSDAWDDAVIVLEQLMLERNTDEERAEAARLALAIHRDRRLDPRSAGPAAEVLLRVDPGDAEALDMALSGALDPHLAEKLLAIGRNALVASTSLDPTQVESLKRLARIADRLGDMQLRQSTLGALVALGHGHSVNKSELMTLERRLSTIPPVALDDDVLAELADPEDTGPIPQLLSLVAPYMEKALGPTLKTFQVGKRERVSASSGSAVRNEIAAWVGAFQLRDFELYVSPITGERIAALATEPVSVIIGSRVTAPLGPFQRQELARSLYALRRGLGVLTQLEELEIAALVVALCNLAGVRLTLPPYARQRDFERELGKALPRKVKQQLPELVKPIVDAQTSIPQWVRAALASLDRAAAIAVGDASVVISELPIAREPLARAIPLASERTRRLLRFVLSPRFEAMRQSVGATAR